ncbi:MAG TPA: YihY/virulence factor BrkB family protein [Polyangiales bacterium]|nr:YihY/virulence factor BrkB family protein [Polyangiales bacterium]
MLARNQILPILKDTIREWSDDNVSRLAAALSYYALLSLAPLLLLMVALLGLIFGEDIAREHVVDAMSSVVGPQGMAAINTIAKSAHHTGTGIGSIIGLGIALFGASGAFVELQASLNAIWNIPPKRSDKVWLRYVIDRAWSFVLVLGVAALLLCSLLSSAVLAIVGEFFEHELPGGGMVWQLMNSAISLGIITLLFAVVFKMLPDVKIRWSDVWLGSFVTALLFVLGNLLLGFYLGKSGVTSSYGGAGSIVALMIWVYYSTQLVFLGAELTQVYTQRVGSHSHLPRPERPIPRSSHPSLSES